MRLVAFAAVAVALFAVPAPRAAPVPSTPMSVVEVGAPKINCVFSPSCTVKVSDSIGQVAFFTGSPPNPPGLVQSRTYEGAAGTPGEGLTAYVYRVNFTAAPAGCVNLLIIDFGKHRPLPYSGKKPVDMFVVTSGGLGSIGINKAERIAGKVIVHFSQPVCGSNPPSQSNQSFFFGLAAEGSPIPAQALVNLIDGTVPVRVPDHELQP